MSSRTQVNLCVEGLTAGILEREAAFVHLVLLDLSSPQMVHAPRGVALHLQIRRLERPLLAHQNIEVVVRGVHARVSLRPERRPKDDQVLSDARVDDVHRAHGAACVVEHPLGRVGVERDSRGGVGGGEVGDDVLDHEVYIVRLRGGGYGGFRDLVNGRRIEDVPSVLREARSASRS